MRAFEDVGDAPAEAGLSLHPVSLPRLSLLRCVDSNNPGNSLWA